MNTIRYHIKNIPILPWAFLGGLAFSIFGAYKIGSARESEGITLIFISLSCWAGITNLIYHICFDYDELYIKTHGIISKHRFLGFKKLFLTLFWIFGTALIVLIIVFVVFTIFKLPFVSFYIFLLLFVTVPVCAFFGFFVVASSLWLLNKCYLANMPECFLPAIDVLEINVAEGVVFDEELVTLVRYPKPTTVDSYYSVPSRIEKIESYAFQGCENLQSINLSNVEEIGDSAFTGTNLKSLLLPKTVKQINGAFDGCSTLQSLEVDPENPFFYTHGDVLFDKNFMTLIRCPQGKVGHYHVPHGVKEIEREAFNSCSELTSVSIPEGVTQISRKFSGIRKVTSFGVFEGCSEMTSIELPKSLVKISHSPFQRCYSLTRIVCSERLEKQIADQLEDGEWTSTNLGIGLVCFLKNQTDHDQSV